jgi:glycosyltransferase involved in cell wall biosynthesis
MPRVAIAMPIYNGADFLRESLDSLLQQTFTDWQCAINNNCSTDETKTIVLEYVAKDSRFLYFENTEFLPVIGNFNRSFQRTLALNSEYFKLLAADDWLYPDYLEKTVRVLDQYPTAGTCSSFRLDDKYVSCHGLEVYEGPLYPGKKRFMEEMTGGPWVTGNITTMLYRSATVKQLDRFPFIFDESTYHADTELARDMLEISDMGFVHSVLSYTRRHKDTVSSNVNRIHTNYANSYNSLYVRMQQYPALVSHFNSFKVFYAYFIIQLWLKRNRKALEWHMANMKRKLTFSDYMRSVLLKNPLSRITKSIFRLVGLR